jgi:hypothetical protein
LLYTAVKRADQGICLPDQASAAGVLASKIGLDWVERITKDLTQDPNSLRIAAVNGSQGFIRGKVKFQPRKITCKRDGIAIAWFRTLLFDLNRLCHVPGYGRRNEAATGREK